MKGRTIRSAVILLIMALVLTMMPLTVSAASNAPGKVKITSMKVGKVAKKTNTAPVTVKWKKVSKATGYEVFAKHGSDDKWKKIKTVGRFTKGLKIKKVSAGKLSVKVRALRKVKGKTYRGKYSAVKSKFITSALNLEKAVKLNGGKAELKKLNKELASVGAVVSFKGNTMTMTIDMGKIPELKEYDLSTLTSAEINALKSEFAKDATFKKLGSDLVKDIKNSSGVKKPTVVFSINNNGSKLFSLSYK